MLCKALLTVSRAAALQEKITKNVEREILNHYSLIHVRTRCLRCAMALQSLGSCGACQRRLRFTRLRLHGAQPHVVRFRECFLTEGYLAIAMEFAAGGDMYRFVTSRCASCWESPTCKI